MAESKETIKPRILQVMVALEPWLLELMRGNASSGSIFVAREESAEALAEIVESLNGRR